MGTTKETIAHLQTMNEGILADAQRVRDAQSSLKGILYRDIAKGIFEVERKYRRGMSTAQERDDEQRELVNCLYEIEAEQNRIR